MVWLAVTVSFLVFAVVAWLAMFPGARDEAGGRAGRMLQRGSAFIERLRRRASQQTRESGQELRTKSAGYARRVSRSKYFLIAAAVMVIVPVSLILGLRQKVILDGGTDPVPVATSSQIRELLEGENLVPPEPPPPEVFVEAERELAQLSPSARLSIAAPEEIVSADRRWEQIDRDFRQRVLAIYKVMEGRGIKMVLVEGFRSAKRQAELAAAGKATRAGAGQSCHQYGLAVDSAPIRNGKLQWDMNDPWTRDAYHLYGQLAQEAGLEWGGSWRSIKDYVHLEQKDRCRAARRAAGAG
ncbi:L-alanyl-D-glutamate peptidase [Lysobacter enzymogenes]|uniref:L-alanyl-D-glutamate peptidase n=1 Tax=Lysobacter enzymogenes TaxID=69 RepID=A0A0S2DBA1_LYSEN|nr:M15 family metallopeptidase [Lysobacter enzymogenes]ALN55786.1 L-alanyl-D-glutamate peptidase [Lysobacter enzymogenes]